MAKIVCIDSNVFVWGIKQIANEDQQDMIPKAKAFLKFLEDNKYKILLPAPVITEILCPVSNLEDRIRFMELARKNFRIGALDDRAAEVAGYIWNTRKDSFKDYYPEDVEGLKKRFKYDILIIGIAAVNDVECIYSNDKGLINAANENGVTAKPIPDIPTRIVSNQTDMFENDKENDQETV